MLEGHTFRRGRIVAGQILVEVALLPLIAPRVVLSQHEITMDFSPLPPVLLLSPFLAPVSGLDPGGAPQVERPSSGHLGKAKEKGGNLELGLNPV